MRCVGRGVGEAKEMHDGGMRLWRQYRKRRMHIG